jgi:hypothetical protein
LLDAAIDATNPIDRDFAGQRVERVRRQPTEFDMSKLTTEQRKKLPNEDFALSGRRYPVEDKAHARDAKARASQQYDKGNLSAADKAKVDKKADTVLKKSGK